MTELLTYQNKIQYIIFNYFYLLQQMLLECEDSATLPIDFQRISKMLFSKKNLNISIGQYSQVLLEIYKNIHKRTIRTKRDVYYTDTNLFKTQSFLDAIVSEISNRLKVPRDALNLVATGKGLVFGGMRINGLDIRSVQLIHSLKEIKSLVCNAKFVLVVEKDAVMTTIVQHYEEMVQVLGEFVIITGKGYPCLKTKQFLNLIQSSFPLLPIYCLVDHDPFGIHICLNYATKSPVRSDI